MDWLPTLEYSLSHRHPKGHWFLLATIVVFLPMLPAIIILNLATLGYDLVPSLQPRFHHNDTLSEYWWGRRRLPAMLRPRAPSCEPRDLGRGDIFRVSGSLFDYTVMSTWNTTEGPKPSGVQEQKRVEYRGESFANCYVNSVRLDYSMVEQTESVNVGVLCPGYDRYPIEVSMQTTITFAWVLSKDFIGQYYGPGLRLLGLNSTNPSDYRKVVLATLEVISTEALTIMRRSVQHLSGPILSTGIVFDVDPGTAKLGNTASTLTYANGSIADPFPYEATIYYDTIANLVVVATHAVNLDLGNLGTPNIFRNASLLSSVVMPNLAPNFSDISVQPADWAEGSVAFYYGRFIPPYQTWAQSLLNGQPVKLGNLTGLPDESVMVTTYLCPSYQIKPTTPLLASVFVGSATMILSAWGGWMYLTTLLARRITEPQVICYCGDCQDRRAKEAEEARERAANPEIMQTGVIAKLATLMGVSRQAKPTFKPNDVESVPLINVANDRRLDAPVTAGPPIRAD